MDSDGVKKTTLVDVSPASADANIIDPRASLSIGAYVRFFVVERWAARDRHLAMLFIGVVGADFLLFLFFGLQLFRVKFKIG